MPTRNVPTSASHRQASTSPVPEPRRPRNPRGQGGRLREEILRAAAELLDEEGTAAAVTLRAVARRAGISAPSIYPHFSGPDAILLAVVQDEFALLREELRAGVAAATEDPVSGLQAMCASYLGYAERRPQRYLLLLGGVWSAAPAVADASISAADVAALGQAVLDDLTAQLQACVDVGASSSDDPRTDATALWLGLHGLAQQRIVSTAMAWPPHLEDVIVHRLALL